MIVYRATGKSPCPAMPEEESLVRQLARGYPMGETLSVKPDTLLEKLFSTH